MLNMKLISLLVVLALSAAAWVAHLSAEARIEQARTREIKQSIRVQPDTATAVSRFKDR